MSEAKEDRVGQGREESMKEKRRKKEERKQRTRGK